MKTDDIDYSERTVTQVEETDSGWFITSDGLGFFVGKEHGVLPVVGQVARFYPAGIGYSVRGLTLDGRVVFYRTPEEQEAHQQVLDGERERDRRAEWEKNAARYEAETAALPAAFKDRLARFRRVNPNFWRYEPYELFVCQEAVKIALALKRLSAVREFIDLGWDEQKKLVPDLDSQHSGNTFGAASGLAYRWLASPELVEKEHGALCPLVGCEEYGCYAAHPEEHDNPEHDKVLSVSAVEAYRRKLVL